MRSRIILAVLLTACGLTLTYRQDAQKRVVADMSGSPVVGSAAAFASSREIRSFVAPERVARDPKPQLLEIGRGSLPVTGSRVHDTDGARARTSLTPMPTPSLSFDGLSNFDNINLYGLVILPPDPIGDVGPAHYVQAVNSVVRVFDKNGAAVTPPFKISDLFQPLGTPCSTRIDGEPVVLYDPLADRWLISQYCNNFPPFRQMIAISKTSDPTGAYFLYEFTMPNVKLNDLSKFGVWPNAYYMSTEEFIGGDFAGYGAFAFDRSKMLVGDPNATYIYFSRPSLSPARRGNLLPSDLDGSRPPPAGAPNVFAGYSATEYGESQDAIRLFDFHADFTSPANSTFTERPESPLLVAAFDPTSPANRMAIRQPPPGEWLDANSDRLAYRAAYRNHGNGESLVLNQTVRLSQDPYRAGVRVYELRRTTGAFTVAEQATIGDTTASRWIASAAQDHQGNLAVGYNHVRDDKQPSILYTGKLASEPAGTFREEATLVEGTGVQRAFGFRWGDYSGMSVDPADDCTFWMTGEYYTLASQEFSEYTWLTRIGRFKFAECTAAPSAVITGNVTNAANGQAVPNATVTASAYSRRTGAGGNYGKMTVLPGTYQVTAAAHGFRPQTFTVNAGDGQAVEQDFALEPVPVVSNTNVQIAAESCGANGAPEPGENISINIALQNTGALATQNLTATLMSGGGVTNPGPPQNYGAMMPNGAAVSRVFTFTVGQSVVCGQSIVLTIHLQDGANDHGNVALTLQTGTPKVIFRENFDRSQFAQLPPRWSRSETRLNPQEPEGNRLWRISSVNSFSPAKSAWVPDRHYVGESEMVSPVIRIQTPNARLTFRNYHKFEATFLLNRLYDGSVLEIRYGAGAWADILAADGVFESGGYNNGLIDGCCQNPLRGRPGWTGRSGIESQPIWITSAVRLPSAAAGQNVQFRWRAATDIGNGSVVEGQYIDDILVTDGFSCGC